MTLNQLDQRRALIKIEDATAKLKTANYLLTQDPTTAYLAEYLSRTLPLIELISAQLNSQVISAGNKP